MAVFAPMPKASVRRAIRVKVGCRTNARNAYFKSERQSDTQSSSSCQGSSTLGVQVREATIECVRPEPKRGQEHPTAISSLDSR